MLLLYTLLIIIIGIGFSFYVGLNYRPKPQKNINKKILDENKESEKIKEELENELRRNLDKKFNSVIKSLDNNLISSTKIYDDIIKKYESRFDEEVAKSLSLLQEKRSNIDSSINQIVEQRKQQTLDALDNKLISLLNLYLKNGIEGGINVEDQEDYILDNLNKNKSLIIQEIKNA